MSECNIYALIIGINKYQASNQFEDLQAAVNDANDMEHFLYDKLNVPPSHVINLRDYAASRKGILRGFEQLMEITALPEDSGGDNNTAAPMKPVMIIYYAGHGARTRKPTAWDSWVTGDEHIEVLCPSDIGTPIAPGSEEVVQGIPDRTICSLLNKLSAARGNNITLILDCCCSAGLNRSGDAEYIVRRIKNPPPITPTCDANLVKEAGARGLASAAGFAGQFQDSHVLMAACGREQQAYERNGHGLFTERLLSALDKYGVAAITYDSLLTRLRMPSWQTPHFEGKNMKRLLFNIQGSRSDPFLISGHRDKAEDDSSIYILEAGSAQGVEPNSQFTIHRNNFLSIGANHGPNKPLGTLIATSVSSFVSYLEFPDPTGQFKIPQTFYAKWGDLSRQPVHVFSPNTDWLETLFPPNIQQRLGIRLAQKPDDASIILTLQNDTVYFDRNDTLAKPFIGSRFAQSLPFTPSTSLTTTETIYEVVRSWRHFYYHLTRSSPREFPGVHMELHYLEEQESSDNEDDYPWSPTPTYILMGTNLIAAEPAYIDVKEGCCVGMTLYNDTDDPLYPYLLYFDPTDLKIVMWPTTPQGAGIAKYSRDGVDCPLPPHSKLPLGYGSGGTPWEFEFSGEEEEDSNSIPAASSPTSSSSNPSTSSLAEKETPEDTSPLPREKKDVGFFKLFIAASPANFGALEQETSPFEYHPSRSSTVQEQIAPDGEIKDPTAEKLDPNAWGCQLATIVQILPST